MKKTIMKRGLIAGVGAVVTGSLLFGLTGVFADPTPANDPSDGNGIAPTFTGVHVEGVIDNPDATVNGGDVMISDTDTIHILAEENATNYVDLAVSEQELNITSRYKGAPLLDINYSANNGVLTTNNMNIQGSIYNSDATVNGGVVVIDDTDGVQLGSDTDGLLIAQNGDISDANDNVTINDRLTVNTPFVAGIPIDVKIGSVSLLKYALSFYGDQGDIPLVDAIFAADNFSFEDGEGNKYMKFYDDGMNNVLIGDSNNGLIINKNGEINDNDGAVVINDSDGVQLGSDAGGLLVTQNGYISDNDGGVMINDDAYINGNWIQLSTNDIGITLTDDDNIQLGSDSEYINIDLGGVITHSSGNLEIASPLDVTGKITASGGIGTYVKKEVAATVDASSTATITANCDSGYTLISATPDYYNYGGTNSAPGIFIINSDVAPTGSNFKFANTSTSSKSFDIDIICYNPAL